MQLLLAVHRTGRHPAWTALLASFIAAPVAVCWFGLAFYAWSTLERPIAYHTAEVEGRRLTEGDRVELTKEGEKDKYTKDVLRPGEVGTITKDWAKYNSQYKQYTIRGPRGDAPAFFSPDQLASARTAHAGAVADGVDAGNSGLHVGIEARDPASETPVVVEGAAAEGR